MTPNMIVGKDEPCDTLGLHGSEFTSQIDRLLSIKSEPMEIVLLP